MQFSLKTLMLAAGGIALIAAISSKFGGIGLLYGLVLSDALVILYCFTKLPLRPALANGLLFGAIVLHVVSIYSFFPVAEDWANEAMYAATARGYEMQYEENEMQGFFMGLFVFFFGYLPIVPVFIFLILILLPEWKLTGIKRSMLSRWLLAIPFLTGWFAVYNYTRF